VPFEDTFRSKDMRLEEGEMKGTFSTLGFTGFHTAPSCGKGSGSKTSLPGPDMLSLASIKVYQCLLYIREVWAELSGECE